MTAPAVRVFETTEALADAAAATIVAVLHAALAGKPVASLVLAGGSSPERAYALLATAPLVARIAWDRLDIFWGDERAVGPDDPRSNYGMARRVLLEPARVPAARVHRIEGELAPSAAARRYETTLRGVLGAAPRFDLVLLGMGADGHTASLFPGATWDDSRMVEAPIDPRPGVPRISMTPRLLTASEHLVFLVTGRAKAATLAQVLDAPESCLPAARIAREHGSPTWLVDREAASLLPPA